MADEWPSVYFTPEAVERIVAAAGGWPDSVPMREREDFSRRLAKRLEWDADALKNRTWLFYLDRDPIPADLTIGGIQLRGEPLAEAAAAARAARNQRLEHRRARGERPERGRPLEPTTAWIHDLMGLGLCLLDLPISVTGQHPYGRMVAFCTAATRELQECLQSGTIVVGSPEFTERWAAELRELTPERIRERIRYAGSPSLTRHGGNIGTR